MRQDFFVSPALAAVWLGLEPRWSWTVLIADADGVMQSWSARGLVLGFDWGDSNDNFGQDANISIRWRRFGFNSSPWVEGTPWEGDLLEGRRVQITGRLYCEGQAILAPQTYFDGVIDKLTLSPDSTTATITCRDRIVAYLQDRWIESASKYGTADGRDLDLVLSDILAEWMPRGVIPDLRNTATIDFAILTYEAPPSPIMQALSDVAVLRGYDLRSLWNNLTQRFELTLIDPPRSASTPESGAPIFTSGYWRAAPRAETGVAGVRNVIKVTYVNGTSPSGDLTQASVFAVNTTSVARYGRQWMELIEGSTSPIRAEADAQDLADKVLADLALPDLEFDVDIPCYPWVEVNDLYQFGADGLRFGADQVLACVSYRHTVSLGGAVTSLRMRGKPAVGRRVWLSREARPGAGTPANTTSPLALKSAQIAGRAEGAELKWSWGTDGTWDTTEVHRGLTADFTPSQETLLTSTRALAFTDRTAAPGTVHHYKLVPKAQSGAIGSPLPDLQAQAGFVTRRTLEPVLRSGAGLSRITSAQSVSSGDTVVFNNVLFEHGNLDADPTSGGVETNLAPFLADVRVTILPGTQDCTTWYATVWDDAASAEVARSATAPASQALTISDVISLPDDGFLYVRVYPIGAGGTAQAAIGSSFKVISLAPGTLDATPTPPTLTVSPSISGTPTVGEVLTGADGTGGGTIAGRAWYADGAPIAGATSATFTLTSAQVDKRIQYFVTRVDSTGGRRTDASALFGPIASDAAPPTGTVSITGTTTEGQTLTADLSLVSGATSTAVTWYRSGSPIATGTTYLLTAEDVGAYITIQVLASNADGDTLIGSSRVGPIAAASAPPPSDPALLLEDGDRLLLEDGDKMLLE